MTDIRAIPPLAPDQVINGGFPVFGIGITLKPHQVLFLSNEGQEIGNTVTINGPSNATVLNFGTYEIHPNHDQLRIIGPQLQGVGTIQVDGSTDPLAPVTSGTLEFGAVGRGEIINFVGVDPAVLQLDKPLQFLGTIHGQQDAFTDNGPPVLSPTGNVLNAEIQLPTITGFDLTKPGPYGHAVFKDHVLSIYDGSDHLEARLDLTGVNTLTLVGSNEFRQVAGLVIDREPTPDNAAFVLTNNGAAVYA